MTNYEYSAVPAPHRSEKSKDSKTATDRYAATLTAELNRMATDGWEYVRADVLPSEERSGLTGRSLVYHNLLIFRRQLTVEGPPAGTELANPTPQTLTKPAVKAAAPHQPEQIPSDDTAELPEATAATVPDQVIKPATDK